jgi:hypothetical protein
MPGRAAFGGRLYTGANVADPIRRCGTLCAAIAMMMRQTRLPASDAGG